MTWKKELEQDAELNDVEKKYFEILAMNYNLPTLSEYAEKLDADPLDVQDKYYEIYGKTVNTLRDCVAAVVTFTADQWEVLRQFADLPADQKQEVLAYLKSVHGGVKK